MLAESSGWMSSMATRQKGATSVTACGGSQLDIYKTEIADRSMDKAVAIHCQGCPPPQPKLAYSLSLYPLVAWGQLRQQDLRD
jgi:hypothetical protein